MIDQKTYLRDYQCAHCAGVVRGDDPRQVVHESDCQTLIEYAEILKQDPEAVMVEDLVPLGPMYTVDADGNRHEL